MKIVITGGRDYALSEHVFEVLDALQPTIIAQGECRTGADFWARRWASSRGIRCTGFSADWTTHGRAAGPVRNRVMLETFQPDLVVAFPGGRGTADCVRQAISMNFRTVKVNTPS